MFTYSYQGGIAMCFKCSTNDTMNGKSEVHLMPNDYSDVKDQPSPLWTDTETLLLLEAVLKHGDDWDLIAQHVRTKNKLDCISRLIHLPFGEHMLGTISTKSSKTNLSTPLEFKSSVQVLNDNPTLITETGGDQLVEINKTAAEIVNLGHPLKRRCFPPFTDATDSFMKKVSSVSDSSCFPARLNQFVIFLDHIFCMLGSIIVYSSWRTCCCCCSGCCNQGNVPRESVCLAGV